MNTTIKLSSTSSRKFVRFAFYKIEIMTCCCVTGAMTLITKTALIHQLKMSLKYGFARSVNCKLPNSRGRKVYICISRVKNEINYC